MKKLSRFFGYVITTAGTVSMLPMKVLAQADWMPDNPGPTSLDELIKAGLNTAIVIAAVVAVFYLIYNGFKYMMAGGDAGKTEEAQKGLANALIGLVVCLAAALIVNFLLMRLFNRTPESID